MPNITATDRFDLATGLTYRTCRECATELPLTAENFYRRDDRPHERRCQTCRRRRDAANRAARRAGRSVRGGRKFGVEIEYIGTSHAVEMELARRGLRVYNAGYTHRVMSAWKIVRDASVMNGFELVSPPLSGANGINQLKLACEALAAAGAQVNRTCGLHVHHDVSDLDARAFGRLFRTWSNNQRNIDALVAPSRRSSQWAQPLNGYELERIESLPSTDRLTVQRHLGHIDRYRSLNVAAFTRYGTVEVRQHQGTCSFDKIAAWVAFGQALIALAKSDSANVHTHTSAGHLLDALAAHGLAADKIAFLKGRAAHFAGRRQTVGAAR